MKNLKRTVAVFVSAIMVMAMLAGCGGGSGNNEVDLGKLLRDAMGASQRDDLDDVAKTLANAELTTQSVKSAVSECGELYEYNGQDLTTAVQNENGAMAVVATTEITETGARGNIITIIQYEGMTTDEVVEYVKSNYDGEGNLDDNEILYIAAKTTSTTSGIVVMSDSYTYDSYENISSGFGTGYALIVFMLNYASQSTAG